jgi:hypothetical protein
VPLALGLRALWRLRRVGGGADAEAGDLRAAEGRLERRTHSQVQAVETVARTLVGPSAPSPATAGAAHGGVRSAGGRRGDAAQPIGRDRRATG